MITIREAGRRLRAGEVSSVELTQQALKDAERGSRLNAFITVTGEAALMLARFLDDELRAGRDRGPLHGIPVALKDLYFTQGVKTTNGSKIFADFVPDYDATVVTKLEAAGAISIGKLNQHEMAYGVTSNNPHYGPVRNPWNPDCIAGGSSGGSGATVANGTVFAAMGSDTGGSIRHPAALCGVVGLKPTFGRVSRHGCFQLGLTLDTMGPLTRTVEDAGIVFNAIAGYDPRDESTVDRPYEDFAPLPESELEGIRIGVPENFYTARLHDDVANAYRHALTLAEEAGAELVPIHVPDPAALNVVARTILLCEASAVLEPWLDRRDEFGEDVLALMDQGRLIRATDYVNAQRLRRVLQREWNEVLSDIDIIAAPTSPIPAPRIGQKSVLIGGEEEDTRLASTRFLRGINVLGFPALSIPCGISREGLPIGLQLIAGGFEEAHLLEYGAAFERILPRVSPGEAPAA